MTLTTRIVLAALVLGGGVTLATASDHRWGREREHDREHDRDREREGRAGGAAATSADPGGEALYRKECGACHLAFPPGMLPAGAHRSVLAGLERHFGQNAELDAPVRDRLERWLVANAGGGDASSLRLTDQPRFRRKHRKIGPDVVARPAVKTLANCAACHGGAQDWDFEEDRVKIPR